MRERYDSKERKDQAHLHLVGRCSNQENGRARVHTASQIGTSYTSGGRGGPQPGWQQPPPGSHRALSRGGSVSERGCCAAEGGCGWRPCGMATGCGCDRSACVPGWGCAAWETGCAVRAGGCGCGRNWGCAAARGGPSSGCGSGRGRGRRHTRRGRQTCMSVVDGSGSR